MPARLPVTKTYKMYVNGAFPRSESGRSLEVRSPDGDVVAHACHASRKDLRDAVGAAAGAQPKWAARTAYNRGQILYRMGEMLEGKADEFVGAIRATDGVGAREARKEVAAAVDRLVAFAGWADKFSQVLACHNPVAGAYDNFTVAEPTGVVAVVAPARPALLGLISLAAPPLAAGCAIVALAHKDHPLPACVLGEVCQTSDLPAGALNILTGDPAELAEWIAGHREIDAVHGADLPKKLATVLRRGAAENVKRVRVRDVAGDPGGELEPWLDEAECESPWWIEPFVEMKTTWRPAAT